MNKVRQWLKETYLDDPYERAAIPFGIACLSLIPLFMFITWLVKG